MNSFLATLLKHDIALAHVRYLVRYILQASQSYKRGPPNCGWLYIRVRTRKAQGQELIALAYTNECAGLLADCSPTVMKVQAKVNIYKRLCPGCFQYFKNEKFVLRSLCILATQPTLMKRDFLRTRAWETTCSFFRAHLLPPPPRRQRGASPVGAGRGRPFVRRTHKLRTHTQSTHHWVCAKRAKFACKLLDRVLCATTCPLSLSPPSVFYHLCERARTWLAAYSYGNGSPNEWPMSMCLVGKRAF